MKEKVGNALLMLLKKHFGVEGPMESYDEDLGKPMNAKGALRKKMRARQESAYGDDSEMEDFDAGVEDDEDEDEDGQYLDEDDEGEENEEEGDEDEQEIPKEHRKRMSIAVLSKKFSKPNRKNM